MFFLFKIQIDKSSAGTVPMLQQSSKFSFFAVGAFGRDFQNVIQTW